jgi:hypothetical protein
MDTAQDSVDLQSVKAAYKADILGRLSRHASLTAADQGNHPRPVVFRGKDEQSRQMGLAGWRGVKLNKIGRTNPMLNPVSEVKDPFGSSVPEWWQAYPSAAAQLAMVAPAGTAASAGGQSGQAMKVGVE